MGSVLKSVSPVLSQANQLQLARQLVDTLGSGIAIAATVDPFNGNNAATLTDAIDLREFQYALFILAVGVIDEAVDFEVRSSDLVGGTYTLVTGKVITQLADTDDNKQAQIIVKLADLPAGDFFVKGVVTVGAGTSSLVCVIGLGVGPKDTPVEDIDLASVAQIVGKTTYRGSVCQPIPHDFTLNENLAVGDCTFATTSVSSVSLDSWDGPLTLPGGRVGMHHNVSFIAGVTIDEDYIYGYMITDNAGTINLHAEKFATPVPIVREGDGVVLDLFVPILGTLTTGLTN